MMFGAPALLLLGRRMIALEEAAKQLLEHCGRSQAPNRMRAKPTVRRARTFALVWLTLCAGQWAIAPETSAQDDPSTPTAPSAPMTPAAPEGPEGHAPPSDTPSAAAAADADQSSQNAAPATPEGPPAASGWSDVDPQFAGEPHGPPLFIGGVAGWGHTFGSGHCDRSGRIDSELVARITATMQRWSHGGVEVAVGGAFPDHPVIAYAAAQQPQLLAALIANAGVRAVSVGIEDLNGPLLRQPALSRALTARGIAVVASNFVCAGERFCADWHTAEDPVLILEHAGQRFALISLLPDDTLTRVEPAAGRHIELKPAAETLAARTQEARRASARVTIASIDYGHDPTAVGKLSEFATALPADKRPDVLLHPNASAEQVLFQRPRGVRPAVVGTRDGEVTVLRITELTTGDTDVFARSAHLDSAGPQMSAQLRTLSTGYCRAEGAPLPGAMLGAPMNHAQLVELAANATRELRGADVAILDPELFEANWSRAQGTRLQRGEVASAQLQDASLVEGNVDREWIQHLLETFESDRPLTVVGVDNDDGSPLIAGRAPVADASYRVVTTSVLARSGRLHDGVTWTPVDDPRATVQQALLAFLEVADPRDPRYRVRDPRKGTQWVFRADAEARGNLTSIRNPADYDEPTLQVDPSRQLVLRTLINWDADAPDFLFENILQVNFDRNYATDNTAQDLTYLRTTYTYRGLWSSILLKPHPFIESYIETRFLRDKDQDYHHLLLRPQVGLRSEFSSVLSLKLSAGAQSEAFAPDSEFYFGFGAELLLKPWTIDVAQGTLTLEGNVLYYWNAPTSYNRHLIRGQLTAGLPVLGPLQLTMSTVATWRDDKDLPAGLGLGLQGGVRVRFVDRSMPR